MRISDWSSDVCSSDLVADPLARERAFGEHRTPAAKHADQPEIGQNVEREGGGGAERGDDHPAYRRADAAREVEPHRIERDRARQILADRKSTRLNSSH